MEYLEYIAFYCISWQLYAHMDGSVCLSVWKEIFKFNIVFIESILLNLNNEYQDSFSAKYIKYFSF